MVSNPDAILVLLDGDDWLVNDPDIFSYVNEQYYKGARITYGSCHSLVDNIDLIAQPYPRRIREQRAYRDFLFSWGIPYTHLRTFSRDLYDRIDIGLLTDDNGKYFGAAGDGALLYALLEAAEPDEVVCIQRILINYNDINSLNDYKVNKEEQTRNGLKIRNLRKERNQDKAPEAVGKRVLIAMPTAKYIEADTFTSLYSLIRPAGYTVDFQYFYGYNVAQVRNLIAHYGIANGYDYIFWVDSDIVLPKTALIDLLAPGKGIVSGVYVQRSAETVPEIYEWADGGGMRNARPDEVMNKGVREVAGCGFGCVLTTTECLSKVGYPQFEYHNAIEHKDTLSEDIDFCIKAKARGYGVYVHTGVRCGHIGNVQLSL
jgi:hypothetical protein